jgi:hypothetical protein
MTLLLSHSSTDAGAGRGVGEPDTRRAPGPSRGRATASLVTTAAMTRTGMCRRASLAFKASLPSGGHTPRRVVSPSAREIRLVGGLATAQPKVRLLRKEVKACQHGEGSGWRRARERGRRRTVGSDARPGSSLHDAVPQVHYLRCPQGVEPFEAPSGEPCSCGVREAANHFGDRGDSSGAEPDCVHRSKRLDAANRSYGNIVTRCEGKLGQHRNPETCANEGARNRHVVAADVEHLFLLRRPAGNVRGTALPRRRVPAAAGRAELGLVVDVRGSGRQPVRTRATAHDMSAA